MLNQVRQNIKNMIGWKTSRKIIVFSIDDYGNVRIASRKAREALEKAGIFLNRYDQIDTLENKQDLEEMFDTLSTVKDINGNHPVLTAFAVPCNIDFEKMAEDNFQNYHYELLTQTFSKLASKDPHAYDGAWSLWQEGISKRLLVPQFHGREHFNLSVFKERLRVKDIQVLTALRNSSNAGISNSGNSRIPFAAAFGFWNFEENYRFESIVMDGLNAFEKVFGYRSVNFNAPCGSDHKIIHGFLGKNGIKYIDNPLLKKEHQGQGRYKTALYYTGKKDSSGITYLVRNVVFEPTEKRDIDWVNYSMQQIETAFNWHRPAVISSHRAHFCGHIEPEQRRAGLSALKALLEKITQKWPDVEFMSADQLGDLIAQEK